MAQSWAKDIEEITQANKNFRRVLHVGKHLELTVMSIPPGGEIGVEVHRSNDQFLCFEAGQGVVKTGRTKSRLTRTVTVEDDWGVVIPAGTWHNVINTGRVPLRLFTLYGPPEHARGTVHRTKAQADRAEAEEHAKARRAAAKKRSKTTKRKTGKRRSAANKRA
jgi:mannose-6-phosphate isomerase-like protein (cupin superfamily)